MMTSSGLSDVQKDYVLDYTSSLKDVIMEKESGDASLTYRYTYGLEKISVTISNIGNGFGNLKQNGLIKLWYHHDRLGSTYLMTDNVKGDGAGYADYNEWGEAVKVVNMHDGKYFDLVTEFTGHPYDGVIGLYFAEARMYDAADRRFASVDPVRGSVGQPATMVRYLYVLDNPTTFIDPTGEFLIGTRMVVGAYDRPGLYDKNVETLQKALDKPGLLRNGQYPTHIPIIPAGYIIGFLDHATMDAVGKYMVAFNQDNPGPSVSSLNFTDVVTVDVWRALGLKVNNTIEEEFFSGRRGNDTLSVSISGNTVTIDYNPKIFIQANVGRSEYYQTPSCERFPDLKHIHVSAADYSSLEQRIVDGFMRWGGTFSIQGETVTVVVNVNPTREINAARSDVRVNLHDEGLLKVDGMVFWSLTWNVNTDAGIELWLDQEALDHDTGRKEWDYISNLVMHEFGHTLGLMDAYGAFYQPQAPASRVSKDTDTVMWNHYHAGSFPKDIEIEMLLYAWTRNKMQGFSQGPLGEDSQAFYN
jgi:RHS repeat-associated protein